MLLLIMQKIKRILTLASCLYFATFAQLALCLSLESGINVYQRVAGVPPTSEEISEIESLANSGDYRAIARLAMKNKSFYRSTLKYWASAMTNVTQLPSVDLNDFSATVIGIFRDEVPLKEMLYEDILYIGNSTELVKIAPFNAGVTLKAYSDADNNHYRQLDIYGVDLSDPNLLIRTTQSGRSILPPEATMGVMTTRTAGLAFLKDGTNRRMVRFSMVNFHCRDMEQLHDITIPDYRVRQDVPRNAGGDSSTYITKCAGCHAGMDALAGAFALHDFVPTRNPDNTFSNRVIYLPTVANKFFRNDFTYPDGHVTLNESWINLWTRGQNADLGWRFSGDENPYTGTGAKALGVVLAGAKAFSVCMAQRTYTQVCGRTAPFDDGEKLAFTRIANVLESSNYNGKVLFEESVGLCVGE